MPTVEVVTDDKSKWIVAGILLTARRDARSIDAVPTFRSFDASSRVLVSVGRVETTPPIGGFVFIAFEFPTGAPCFNFAHLAATIAR